MRRIASIFTAGWATQLLLLTATTGTRPDDGDGVDSRGRGWSSAGHWKGDRRSVVAGDDGHWDGGERSLGFGGYGRGNKNGVEISGNGIRDGHSSLEHVLSAAIDQNSVKTSSKYSNKMSDDSDDSPPSKKLKKASSNVDISEISYLNKVAAEREKTSASIMEYQFNNKRTHMLSAVKQVPRGTDGIIYWTFRDQRVHDNWALLYAQQLAIENKVSLHIVFCRPKTFLGSTLRHYNYLIEGLKELEEECKNLNIQFHFLIGGAEDILPDFVRNHMLGAIVVDFMPLREHMLWTRQLADRIGSVVPVIRVDAHNIVPCWVTTEKQEYSARSIRYKINTKLIQFLTEFPPVIKHPYSGKLKAQPINWEEADKNLQIDRNVLPVPGLKAGFKAGMLELENFMTKRLSNFSIDRYNPVKDGLSNLSPWLHFGQISAQRCVLEVSKLWNKYVDGVASYREDAIMRRELSDNYCFYNPRYDSIEGAPRWAQVSLNEHRKDRRKYMYTREEFEKSRTHDKLWNTAQIQLVKEGKMHSLLRKYWAKKILEWTDTPERALADAIYLNDKYSIDGQDPNGYAGCMWAIGGVHDRGWDERPVMGKIRYMNYNGCKRKFDVDAFIVRYNGTIHNNTKI